MPISGSSNRQFLVPFLSDLAGYLLRILLAFVYLNNMATQDSAASSRTNAQLKTPKGTRDWVGQDLLLRDHIL